MKIKVLINLLLLALLGSVYDKTFAQLDPQYTQFYANSLYLNPAFAGSTECARAFMIGRLQWPGFQAAHTTGTVSFDNYLPKIKSGLGAMITQDYNPGSGLNYLDISAQYAYKIDLSENLTFRPALQIGLGKRSIDYSKLDFNAQYTNSDGVNKELDNKENFSKNSITYPDVAAGGVLYSKNAWIGLSTHHMNRPKQNFINGPKSNLDMLTSVHGGMKLLLKEKARPRYGIIEGEEETSISPTFNYRMQGSAKQLDIGLYGRYNYIVVGAWYRGLPVFKTELTYRDAMNFLVGFIYEQFNVGYSYDMTVSKLGKGSGGAHELSIAYTWCPKGYPKRKIKRRNTMKKKKKSVWPLL